MPAAFQKAMVVCICRLTGHFQTSLGFETAWPFQDLSGQSQIDLFDNEKNDVMVY